MEPFPGSPDYFISEAGNLRAELAYLRTECDINEKVIRELHSLNKSLVKDLEDLRTLDPARLEAAARETGYWPEPFIPNDMAFEMARKIILAYLGKTEEK